MERYRCLNTTKLALLEMGGVTFVKEGLTEDGRYFREFPRQEALSVLKLLEANPGISRFIRTLDGVKDHIYEYRKSNTGVTR